MYCLSMLAIALELAKDNPPYEDIASKFFEHFLHIADAMNHIGNTQLSLWDEADSFYYDVLHLPHGDRLHLKVRSMVGLIPLFAVETLEAEILDTFPGFKKRFEWFVKNRPHLTRNIACMETGISKRRLLAIVNPDKLRKILHKMLDETEFLSPYGIRSVSKFHEAHPYTFTVDGYQHRVQYEPAESTTGMFGGNSNWRGPIWFPVNYLIIESLQKFHGYLGDDFKVECPTGSGKQMNLREVATELSQRLIQLFLQNPQGQRPIHGSADKYQNDHNWRDLLLFYEHFHGDNGAGLGANHQTGWTGLVAQLMHFKENQRQ